MSFPNLTQDICSKIMGLEHEDLTRMIDHLGMFLAEHPELGDSSILHELLARLEYELNERLRVWHESFEREDDFARDNYHAVSHDRFPSEPVAWC